jgi:hypothetical protein
MADNIRKMLDITGTMFADGQVAKALTPQKFRDTMETMKTQYAYATFTAGGTFTTAAVGVWKAINMADALTAGNGFSRAGAGLYQYDAPPVDSVSLANGTRNFLAVGIASVEPLTAPEEFSFAFGVDGIVPATGTIQSEMLTTLVQSNIVTFGGVITGLGNGNQVAALCRNDTAGNNLTINSISLFLMGLND